MKENQMKHMAVPLDAYEKIKAFAASSGLTHPEAIRQMVLKAAKQGTAKTKEVGKAAGIGGAVILILAGGIWGLFDAINQTLVTGVIP
jgi:hypothetical protein